MERSAGSSQEVENYRNRKRKEKRGVKAKQARRGEREKRSFWRPAIEEIQGGAEEQEAQVCNRLCLSISQHFEHCSKYMKYFCDAPRWPQAGSLRLHLGENVCQDKNTT